MLPTFFTELEKYQLTKLLIENCKVQKDDKISPEVFGSFQYHFFRPGISIVSLCLGINIASNLFPLHNNQKKEQLLQKWLQGPQVQELIASLKKPTVQNNNNNTTTSSDPVPAGTETSPSPSPSASTSLSGARRKQQIVTIGTIIWLGLQSLFSSSTHPFKLICSYFGEQISFYFAWFNYYNKFLIFPAFFGLFVSFQRWTNIRLLDEGDSVLLYTISVIIWGTLFTQMWRRHSMDLALEWGVFDFKEKEQPRPGFQGELQKSPITGEYELVYPRWKSILRFAISCVVFAAIVLLTYGVMVVFFRKRAQFVKNGHFWASQFTTFFYSAFITLVSHAFQKVAVMMNHWENIRTESEYADRLAIRIFIFECLNSYGSVIYLIFYLRDFQALYNHIFFFIVIRQLFSIFKKSVLTFGWEQYKFYQQRKRFQEQKRAQQNDDENDDDDDDDDDDDESSDLQQYEIEAKLSKYDSSVEDHLHLIIQFGYLTIFASVSPLAPIWALICNLIEIKSQAFQLCFTHQRPWAVKTSGIGILQTLTEMVVLFSVMANVILLGFYTQHYEELWRETLSALSFLSDDITFDPMTAHYGLEEKFLTMFSVEHFVLVVVLLIAQIVRSQTPSTWVLNELKRQNHFQEKLFDALTSVKLSEDGNVDEVELANRVGELQALLSSAQTLGEKNETVQEQNLKEKKEL